MTLLAKKNFIGLQGKTSLLFIGVFVIIILPVNSIIYSNVKKILIAADTRELTSEGERLFNQVRLDPHVVPLPSAGYSIFLSVARDMQSDSLFASPDFPVFISRIPWQPVVEFDTFKIVTLTKPIEYSHAQLIFSIGRNNQRLESQLSELKKYLFAANAASIIVAGLLVYFVSGFTLRPIKKIIQTAQRINASKSIERVPVPTSEDENRQLATAINEMLGRIESSIKNQTNFFASAAHELKTPLAVMQTELSVALQQEADEARIKLLQSQLQEVERLGRVIQDFLLISQLKSETLVVRKSKGKLDEVIYASMKRVKYLTKNRGVQLRLTLHENAQAFLADFDHDKIETVISNLLENAVKFCPAEAVVSISLEKKDDGFELCIANPLDSPVANFENLKDEFQKSNELSAGLGMGLWICDQIMRLHDDKFEIKQEQGIFRGVIGVKI